jgi:hypothetical protein
MKGYRGGTFLVLGLFVAGCQSPASFGGAQPTDSPGESSAPSAEGTGPGDVSTTQPGTTTTSKPSGKGPGPKVLGIFYALPSASALVATAKVGRRIA